MIKKFGLVILALALVACAKKVEPSENKENPSLSRVSEGIFYFQVIQSPVTGKCYEAINIVNSYDHSRIFEISCDYKNKQ